MNQDPTTFYDDDGLRVDVTHGGTGGPIDQSTPLNQEDQQMVNQPLVDPTGLDQDVQMFLESTMKRVYSNEIDTYKPSSLINIPAYEQLDEMGQGAADQKAIVFCSKLRDIKGLMDISGGEKLYAEPTYQIQQLVKELKYHKEEFEHEYGDVFVI